MQSEEARSEAAFYALSRCGSGRRARGREPQAVIALFHHITNTVARILFVLLLLRSTRCSDLFMEGV